MNAIVFDCGALSGEPRENQFGVRVHRKERVLFAHFVALLDGGPALPLLHKAVAQFGKSSYPVPTGRVRGHQAAGNSVRIEMVAFYTFDTASEKLIAEKIYYDQSSALQQMQGNQTARAVVQGLASHNEW